MKSKDFHALIIADIDKIQQEIKSYPTEESIWLTSENIHNSAGNLALHLAGNLQHFIGARLGQDGYLRNREYEFSAKGVSRSALLQELDKARLAVDRTLQNLPDSELTNTYPDEGFLSGRTIGYVLLFMSNHLNYHLGQINYHRRILGNVS